MQRIGDMTCTIRKIVGQHGMRFGRQLAEAGAQLTKGCMDKIVGDLTLHHRIEIDPECRAPGDAVFDDGLARHPRAFANGPDVACPLPVRPSKPLVPHCADIDGGAAPDTRGSRGHIVGNQHIATAALAERGDAHRPVQMRVGECSRVDHRPPSIWRSNAISSKTVVSSATRPPVIRQWVTPSR